MHFYVLNSLREHLVENGFKIGENPDNGHHNQTNWYAYRQTNIESRPCETTNGENIDLYIYPFAYTYVRESACEVEVRGKVDGVWIMVKAYSISIYEVMRRLPDIESKLIAAWNALATDGTK